MIKISQMSTFSLICLKLLKFQIQIDFHNPTPNIKKYVPV
jgi:hypothetical protein